MTPSQYARALKCEVALENAGKQNVHFIHAALLFVSVLMMGFAFIQ